MVAISVVIVNYNGASYLEDCLNSLATQTFCDFEVVFVDNGSSDGSVAKAVSIMPNLRVVELPENRGFSGGNNEGIRRAHGSYVVLLNNDTEAAPQFLEELIHHAQRDAGIGMVAPKILNFYDRTRIDSVGGLILCRDGLAQGRGRGERDCGQYDHLEEALMPSGCAALYRKEMLDEVGLLDDSFFAYCEDTDLGLRGRWAGWKAVAAPNAIVYHKYSGSSGAYSPAKLYLVERNHYRVVLKNFPWTMLMALPLWTLYRYALMACVVVSGKGKGKAGGTRALAGAFFRGHLAALLGSVEALRSRTTCRRIGAGEFRRLLSAHRLGLRDMLFNE